MNINDMDLNEFFGLEPDEEPEGEQVQGTDAEPAETDQAAKSELSPEQRHENAERRRAANLETVRQEERNRMKAEQDAFIKGLGLKDPYNGNRDIETKEQYDEYKRLQDSKALERGLSSGTLTADQFNAAVNAAVEAKLAERTSAPAAAAQDAPAQDYSEVDRQFAEVQAFDPSVKDLKSLMDGDKGKAYMDAVAKTHNMLDAYKLVYFDELQARQAQAGRRDAANRAAEKAHLTKTSTRGNGTIEVTDSMRDAYRIFDPDITDEQIREYESKDQKIRKT